MSRHHRSGILVIDKPAGVTSFDVVDRVRRRLGLRRVGHAGTLDPDATGVLPVLLGEATKLMAYLTEHDKDYRVVVRFGVRTDTQDLSGRVLSRTPVAGLDREALVHATKAFVGRIHQTPPMYSAVHHQGRRLYELAREGLDVPRASREVTVHAVDVEEVGDETAVLRVVCGKGTYVRTLAADLGDALGVGAAVERLSRLRVGPFTLAHAVNAADLEQAAPAALWRRLSPPESALPDWPEARLDATHARAFGHGQAVDGPRAAAGLVRVHDSEGAFIGIGMVEGVRLRPVRILHADRPDARALPA